MTSKTITVNPGQLFDILVPAIKAREPVLIKGKPGVGKTDIESQAAEAAGADNLISHPVTADPTDAKGLPWKVENREAAQFLPFGDLEIAMSATKPLVWFLDDLGQATPAVQASYMQLVLSRRVNGHRLPECVTFIAATNRRSDRAGVSGILEPVKSRFTILELDSDFESWKQWAIKANLRPDVIGFLANRPELLSSKFEATSDITNSPCPRNWAAVSRWMNIGLSGDARLAAVAGRVGEADALSYIGFLEMVEKAPDPDEILKNPQHAPLPKNEDPGICYAVALALSYRSTPKTFAAIATYSQRLYDAQLGDFAVLCLRDSFRRDEQGIKTTAAFQKLVTSPIAKDVFDAFAV